MRFKRIPLVVREVMPGSFALDVSWWGRFVEWVALDGGEVVRVETPGSKPMAVFHLQVGRARRNRYVISDGVVYHDVHGGVVEEFRFSLFGLSYAPRKGVKRAWCLQEAPWRVVKSGKSKPLDQFAKRVIQTILEGKFRNEI